VASGVGFAPGGTAAESSGHASVDPEVAPVAFWTASLDPMFAILTLLGAMGS